jgi:hypothetical protein
MMKAKERYFWAAAFTIVAFVSALPYALTPRPYWDVRIVETEQRGHWRYLTVNFVKGECERVDVVMLGHRLGLSDDLTSTWQPFDGVEEGHDRLAGTQTLSGRLYTGSVSYESFEIRTRHICGGQRVDRTFVTITTD